MGNVNLDRATLLAYRRTHYRVHADTPFVLHVDEFSTALLALHIQFGVRCSAYITACNPQGRERSAAENEAAQKALAGDLNALGISFIPGIGEPDSGDWTGEPSYLVLGLDEAAARRLGRRYEQNAILCAGQDAVPRLVILADLSFRG